MANYTQKAILKTFEEMLNEMPFGKITVLALVARCEVSSNTFYYHFKDIYDLLDTWLDSQKEQLLRETADMENWAEQLKYILHKLQKNPTRIYHVFDSLSRERLERYIFVSMEPEFHHLVQEKFSGVNIPEDDVRMIASFCCYSFLGCILRFLWQNMDTGETGVDVTVDQLYHLTESLLTAVLQQYPPKEQGDAGAESP